MSHCRAVGLLAGILVSVCFPSLWAANQQRQVVCLDSTWQLAEGSMETIPKNFKHQVPVPGLADMARPELAGVGVKEKDPRREAFWYRRTFTIEGPVPAVALLKVHKACFGTRVVLNGQNVGDHLGCFTPGYFDLGKYLKGNGQGNELLIRVGASRTAVPTTIPWGHDFEKIRYIPGIYDSVELLLSGTPHVVRVQAAPDVAAKRVRVVATIRSPNQSVEASICCTVREADSSKVVGSAQSRKIPTRAGQEHNLEVSIPIENCRLWSPEQPFLYELETTTGADTLNTRFGMRSFRFDPKTKLSLLNGKPYPLRGTNICIFRFFEDPARGNKPWRKDWVRAVIRAFRSMHWNSCRFCIGFPPEIWYRVADEEGLMIQDEFPVWGQTGSLDALTQQYTEWMQERWNHPSVVIWDAQNETPNQEITGKALSTVRHLDLSGRPWDNGWAPPQSPTDVYEAHPYRSSDPNFRMAQFARMSPRPGDPGSGAGNPIANKGANPIIINEYGWLWLNRDGTPCTLAVKSYRNLTPPNPTADQLRQAYARALAAKTEFWRCGRQVAGVLHFCGLGYSRTGGQTSDNFIDIDKPTLEPHFFRYVRDAFAPVGLMVNFWADEPPAGKTQKVEVVVINDLDKGWKGRVSLRLAQVDKEDKLLGSKVQDCRVPPLGRQVLTFELGFPEQTGKYQLVAELTGADGQSVRSLRDFAALTAEERAAHRGLAVGRPVTSSSDVTVDGQTFPGKFAVDDDPATRWSSKFSDPQWLAIDLGAVAKISRVELAWEGAFGKSYAIQVSTDGKTWTDVYKTDAGKGGIEEIEFRPTEARWVRYFGTKRGTPFGHSLWELRVFPHAPKPIPFSGNRVAGATPFYAFCVEVGAPGIKPRTLAQQAELLHKLGYDGAGFPLWLGDELDKNLAILDRAGLKVHLLYTSVDLRNRTRPYDPRLIEALPKLKGRPVTLSVLLSGIRPGDPKGMEPAVKVLSELGELARKSGLRVSVYHHVGDWTEGLPFTLEVVKKVNHPSVGANFNLCHWLKIEGSKDYAPLLRAHGDKIFAVTICGAQRDAQTWTNGLIQPLDRGDFDNRRLLATLREAGYRGPIGLMCYGIPDEAEEHLGRSMKVWKTWQAKGK